MADLAPGTVRLRMWATLLLAFAASGLIVFVSSYSALNTTSPSPTVTGSNPTVSTSGPTR